MFTHHFQNIYTAFSKIFTHNFQTYLRTIFKNIYIPAPKTFTHHFQQYLHIISRHLHTMFKNIYVYVFIYNIISHHIIMLSCNTYTFYHILLLYYYIIYIYIYTYRIYVHSIFNAVVVRIVSICLHLPKRATRGANVQILTRATICTLAPGGGPLGKPLRVICIKAL
jgi:hypothetical protein